jgi:hypothetical protein
VLHPPHPLPLPAGERGRVRGILNIFAGISKKFLVYLSVMSRVIENLILSHPKDNVATAKSPIKSGTSLTISKARKIIAKEEIPFAHKIALRRIPRDGAVVKYGERIGRAIREIKPGELVHIHNVVGERGRSKGQIPRPYRRGI